MIAALILALAGQFADARDAAFTAALEDVARSVPGAAPPAPFPDLFRRMGSRDWRERERASRDAVAYCRAVPRDTRWLSWGRHHPDWEVRLRANAAIRRLTPCPSCDGRGRSRNWYDWACTSCGGAGTAWPMSPFE